MKKTRIYLIRLYEMKGKTLHSCEDIGAFLPSEIKMKGNKIISVGNRIASYFYSFSKEPKGVEYTPEGLMPYFANLTADMRIPEHIKGFEAPFYEKAQLKMIKRGAYDLFYHNKNNELVIAMNSCTYEPFTPSSKEIE
jgi:hypothetical protein